MAKPSTIESLIRDYLGGDSTTIIAKRYGISTTTVIKYLHDNDIKLRHGIDEDAAKEIADYYQEGAAIKVVAERFGVSTTTVRNILKRSGIKQRTPQRGFVFDEKTIDDLIARYDSGESLTSLAALMGIKSGEPIRKALLKRGVSLRGRTSPAASSSWPEWAIFYYLKKHFPAANIENNSALVTDERADYPDILFTLPETSEYCIDLLTDAKGLAVEYDGEHWHNSSEQRLADAAKSLRMEAAGYRVIRIIENSNGLNGLTEDGNILCTSERAGVDSGLGFAIATLLECLGVDAPDVQLERDQVEVSRIHYAANSKYMSTRQWVELYHSGLSTVEIAERFDVTPTTVSQRLKQMGVEIRHRPHSEEERAKWLNDYQSGMGVPEISKEYHVDKGVIYNYLRSLGFSFDAPRITEEDRHWLEEFNNGASVQAIAIGSHVSAGKVRVHLLRCGAVLPSYSKVEVGPDDILGWKNLYEDGLTFDEVAVRAGLGTTTVRNYLIKAGVVPRSDAHNKVSADIEQRVVADYKMGLSTEAIAKKFQIDKTTVYRIVKRNDIEVVPRHRVSEEQVIQWKADYEAGKGLSELSAISGFNTDIISKYLRSSGTVMRKGGINNTAGSVDSEMEQEWLSEYQEGAKISDIAKRYSVSDVTVRKHLKRFGVKFGKGGKPLFFTKEREEEAARLYVEGASLKTIAKHFGVSTNAVRSHLVKMGITMRPAPFEKKRK